MGFGQRPDTRDLESWGLRPSRRPGANSAVVEDAVSGALIMLADDLPDEAYASLFEIEFETAPEGACFFYDVIESRWRHNGE